MKNAHVEPGLLALFRLFLVMQLILIGVNLAVHSARGYLSGCPWCAAAFSAFNILALLVYLSWPGLQDTLGHLYIPLALVYAVVFSLVVQNLFLRLPMSITAGSSEESAWQLFLFLFVPLILTSWQYGFKAVIVYCLFTSILDYFLVRYTNPEFLAIQETYRRLLFIRFLSFMLTGYVISRIMQQLRHERQALQDANQKLGRYMTTLEKLTVSQERNRVARELHDTLAHTLTAVAVQLEAADALWTSDHDRAHQSLERSLQATRNGLLETRKAIESLRATPLDDFGLVDALGEYAKRTASRAGFELDLDLPASLKSLPEEVEQCFYRIGQEALENIARHANAKQVRVRLVQSAAELQATELRLEIVDDGVGVDPQAATAESHFGLQGMCERAEIIKAAIDIDSRPGQGTRLTLVWNADGLAGGTPR